MPVSFFFSNLCIGNNEALFEVFIFFLWAGRLHAFDKIIIICRFFVPEVSSNTLWGSNDSKSPQYIINFRNAVVWISQVLPALFDCTTLGSSPFLPSQVPISIFVLLLGHYATFTYNIYDWQFHIAPCTNNLCYSTVSYLLWSWYSSF